MATDEEVLEGEPEGSKFRAFCELVRLPNLFTAMADVLAGMLIVHADGLPMGGRVIGLLIVASTLLYAAGVTLNDLFDYKLDQEERPERPLPSGRISLRFARWLGWECLFFGTGLTWIVALVLGRPWPGLVGTLLAICIVAYNAFLKRTAAGPIAMGLCRFLNVLLGLSVSATALLPVHWVIAAAVGIYIAGVTWFARSEADVSGRMLLGFGVLVMAAGLSLLATLPRWGTAAGVDNPLIARLYNDPSQWYMLIGLLGALILWRCLLAVANPLPEHVQTAVANSITSLVMLDGAACFAFRDALYAAVVVALILPAMMLMQWFRST